MLTTTMAHSVDDIVDWVKPKFMPYGKCTVLGGEANWHSAQAILHRKAVNHENPEQSFVIAKFMKYKLPRVTGIHAVAGIYFSTASNNRRLSVPFADPESATFTVERKLIRNFSSEPSGYVDIDHARKILHNVSQPWTKQLIDGVDPRKAFTVKDKPKVATKETKKILEKLEIKCVDVPESEEKENDDPGEAEHEETKTMVNSELCSVCCKRGLLILCDGCPQAYHAGCINMKMEDVPDEFFCRDHNMKCIKRKSATELEKKLTAKMIAKQKKKVFIPQHTPSHLYITNWTHELLFIEISKRGRSNGASNDKTRTIAPETTNPKKGAIAVIESESKLDLAGNDREVGGTFQIRGTPNTANVRWARARGYIPHAVV